MKNKYLKILIVIIIFVSIITLTANASTVSIKDETVYAITDYDGTITNLYVVNRLQSSTNTYVDYGKYNQVTNLSSSSVPNIDGEMITFTESEVIKGGLYYQGTIQKDLPINLEINYSLDGQVISGEQIGGKSGLVEINVKVTQNLYCLKKLKDNLLTQITMKIDNETVTDLNTFGATTVLTGQLITVSETVLQDENKTMTVSFMTDYMKLEPIVISMIYSSLSLPPSMAASLDEAPQGFLSLSKAMNELANGSSQFTNGLNVIAVRMDELQHGLAELSSSGKQLLEGSNSLTEGISQLHNGSSEILQGLDAIDQGNKLVMQGMTQLQYALNQLDSSHQQLLLLANELVHSNIPSVRALAQGVIDEYMAIAVINGTYNTIFEGNQANANGLHELTTKYELFHSSINQFANGIVTQGLYYQAYFKAIDEASKGFTLLNEGFQMLPEKSDKITYGQITIGEGLNEAISSITKLLSTFSGEEISYTSFVDSRNIVNSLQYVISTKGIDGPKQSEEKIIVPEKKTFFQRIKDLFVF